MTETKELDNSLCSMYKLSCLSSPPTSEFHPASKFYFFYSKNMLSKSTELSFSMPVIACGTAPWPLTQTTTELTQVFHCKGSMEFIFGYSILLLNLQARHSALQISEAKSTRIQYSKPKG